MRKTFDLQKALQEAANTYEKCTAQLAKNENGFYVQNIDELLGIKNADASGINAICNFVGENVGCTSQINRFFASTLVSIVGDAKKVSISFGQDSGKASRVIITENNTVTVIDGTVDRTDETSVLYNITNNDLIDIANGIKNQNLTFYTHQT